MGSLPLLETTALEHLSIATLSLFHAQTIRGQSGPTLFRLTPSCSRRECNRYEVHVLGNADLLRNLRSLRSRTLVCHCEDDQPCPTDVLCKLFFQQRFWTHRPPFADFFDWETSEPPEGHTPLLTFETHPGEAIQQLTSAPHPLSVAPPFFSSSFVLIYAGDSGDVNRWRQGKSSCTQIYKACVSKSVGVRLLHAWTSSSWVTSYTLHCGEEFTPRLV